MSTRPVSRSNAARNRCGTEVVLPVALRIEVNEPDTKILLPMYSRSWISPFSIRAVSVRAVDGGSIVWAPGGTVALTATVDEAVAPRSSVTVSVTLYEPLEA
jgi:hypothetical protein